MADVFERLVKQSIEAGTYQKKSKDSIEYFRRKASKARVSKNNIFSQRSKFGRARIEPGQMYFFKYANPKYKEELPWYDALPVIFPFNEDATHIYGLNLHLIPPGMRVTLLDRLYSIHKGDKLTEDSKLSLSWNVIKSAANNKYYKPTVRTYLKNRVQSDFMEVEAPEWSIAAFLPLADFRKASAQKVYSDARKKIRG